MHGKSAKKIVDDFNARHNARLIANTLKETGRKEVEKVVEKNLCKCQHCGKMTKIHE